MSSYHLTLGLLVVFLLIPNLCIFSHKDRLFPMSPQNYGLCLLGSSFAFILLGASAFCNPIESINWPSVPGIVSSVRASKDGPLIECKFKVNNRALIATHVLNENIFLAKPKIKKGDCVKVHYNPMFPSKNIAVEFGAHSYLSMAIHGAIAAFIIAMGFLSISQSQPRDSVTARPQTQISYR